MQHAIAPLLSQLATSFRLQLFEVAAIANFSPVKQDSYQDSLKYYRDLNNVVDTSWQEGLATGREEGLQEGVRQVARQMKAAGLTMAQITEITVLSLEDINAI